MSERSDLRAAEEAIRRRRPEDFASVDPGDVVTARWVRMKCTYGCGGYGGCLTCPPHSPTPSETREMLDEYETAYLIWWGDSPPGRSVLAEIERDVFLAGHYKAFTFATGPCRLCDPCPLEPPCRHPHQARPSMEACGIDVYSTAHRAGFPLRVVTSHEDTPNFYSLLLVD